MLPVADSFDAPHATRKVTANVRDRAFMTMCRARLMPRGRRAPSMRSPLHGLRAAQRMIARELVALARNRGVTRVGKEPLDRFEVLRQRCGLEMALHRAHGDRR